MKTLRSLKDLILKYNFFKHLPLFTVILIALAVAFSNINLHTYFTGWDNVHPEFDLFQYAYRMVFGAWLEFQGLGAPAAQGHLAEIARLPILFLLKLLVPDNLNRYVFVFLMYLTGGIGTYLYLQKIWLKNHEDFLRDWIAALGVAYYLLNIVTLQQFFIAFEMFTVQFAFFPFLLLSIHSLSDKINLKTILIFLGVQFLIAPSAHTPTVFYLGAVFSVCYCFIINLAEHKTFWEAVKITIFIGLLTFFANCYWIIPNLYYLLADANFVTDNRANRLFDPESLWSVREAGDWLNFLTGTHYIFSWKDFDFRTLKPVYVFETWRSYLSSGLVLFCILLFNLFTLGGLLSSIFKSKKEGKKWGIISIYAVTALFIWMGLFVPGFVIDFVYTSRTFGQVFRNPVTKLSIIYSFTISVFLASFFEVLLTFLRNRKSILLSKMLPVIVVILSFTAIFYVSWPSFTGDFINQKLKVSYPSEYTDMYLYLKTRPDSLRVLELPFFSQAGWSYHKWQIGGEVEGYQGIGFYFFGFPQPLITPDFARWEETNDFLYYELRHALNSQDSLQLQEVLGKYNVDLMLVDESAIDQYNQNYDYKTVHQLLTKTGAKIIWKENYLTIYERTNPDQKDKLIIPAKIDLVSSRADRVLRDSAYQDVGEYQSEDGQSAVTSFPFSDLTSLELKDVAIGNDSVKVSRKLPEGDFEVKIPGVKTDLYKTLAAVTFTDHKISIVFPKTKITAQNYEIRLPQLDDVSVNVSGNYDAVLVWLNEKPVKVYKNTTEYSLVSSPFDQSVQITFAPLLREAVVKPNELSKVMIAEPVYMAWKEDLTLRLPRGAAEMQIETQFPVVSADLTKFASENCGFPKLGTIETSYSGKNAVYRAQNFGVNCNHTVFDFMTPDFPFLMHISGKNVEGRSSKFFISYNIPESLPEEFLAPSGEFSMNIGFLPIANVAGDPYAINWETRSFGKSSQNELDEIKVAPFEFERFSQIRLLKSGAPISTPNTIVVNKTNSLFNFLYFVNADCKSSDCYLGIDQSYDRLWLAFESGFTPLPHSKYNNWANLWKINKSGDVLIVYIPQVVSLLCLFLVIGVTLILVVKMLRAKR